VLKGVSRIPLEMCRLSDQDLVNLEHVQVSKRPTVSTDTGSNSGGTFEIQTDRVSEERAYSVSGIPIVQMTEDIEEHIS
jgi:hypothetical protein